MSTAGYLQDAKNQQKRLAETITAKGITATATEKYKDLVDKVAQIENLKGEERTLENFTNALSEPKSIVQLEYPDNTPKILNAKLGSKNLLDPSVYYSRGSTFKGITYTVNNDTVTMTGIAEGSSYINILSSNPDAKLDMSEQLKNKKLRLFAYGATSTVEAVLYDEAGTFIRIMHSNDTSATDTTGCSKWSLRLRFNNGQTYNDTIKIMICEEGVEDSPSYTPYISDFSTVNVTRCGKNLINNTKWDGASPFTTNGVTFTVNDDGSVTANGTATGGSATYYNRTLLKSVANKTFTISGITGGSSTTYRIRVSRKDKAYTDLYDGYKAFTPDGDIEMVILSIHEGVTVNNLVFKPQLELGSTATPYETYQGQTYTPTTTGEVTGITNLYPTTTLLTDNAGVVFEQVTGGFYKEILPSTDKNGITKVYQPSVDSTIDSNIKPENIKKGVKILGILGTYDGN